MAKMRRDYDPEEIRYPDQKIVQSDLVHEMEDSYIEYAMSVIVGRALPDVRDGLKPVHRRILYAMYEDNLTRDKPFKKCATCVGDVLGRYHPHGDASRSTTPWCVWPRTSPCAICWWTATATSAPSTATPRPPTVTPRPGWPRCADEMLRDIDKDTVDWDPNFDETPQGAPGSAQPVPQSAGQRLHRHRRGHGHQHPAPQPAARSSTPCICVLDDPEADPGRPDGARQGPGLPHQGHHHGPQRHPRRPTPPAGAGSSSAPAPSSRSSATTASASSSPRSPIRSTRRMLIKNIADQVEDKRLEGISDIRDESDRNGMRIVIELKRDANPQVVLNRLFAQTQLQTTFAINMLALVESTASPSPRSSPCATSWTSTSPSRRRSSSAAPSYDLRKAQERAHLLEGLLIAQDNIDEVIQIIREQLRRRQGEPDGPLRPGRRAGPGHSGHAAQAPPGPGTGEAGERIQGAGRRASPTIKQLLWRRERCSAACSRTS